MSKVVALLGLVLILVGCQPTMSVSSLPPPTFSRPNIVVPPAVVARSPKPVTPVAGGTRTIPVAPPPAIATGNVPAGWVPAAPARPWKWIVIHHSATPTGGAKAFDKMHRAKGWDELGYHFVIGNGTDTRDGQIEIGSRWPKQKYGAHTKTPDNQYNDVGIGICLVGNFDVTRPTQAQLRSMAKLVSFLMKRYNIPPSRVIGHRDAKPTDCPGRNVNIQVVRRMATQMLADSGQTFTDEQLASLISSMADGSDGSSVTTDGDIFPDISIESLMSDSPQVPAGTELMTDSPASDK